MADANHLRYITSMWRNDIHNCIIYAYAILCHEILPMADPNHPRYMTSMRRNDERNRIRYDYVILCHECKKRHEKISSHHFTMEKIRL